MRLSTPIWTQWRLMKYLVNNPTHIEWKGECPCGCGKWYVGTVKYGEIGLSRRCYELLECSQQW